MSDLLSKKINDLEKRKEEIELQLKQLYYEKNIQEIEARSTEQKKSILEKNNIKSIRELFDHKHFSYYFYNIVWNNEIETYNECLDFAENFDKINNFKHMLPQLLSVMISNNYIHMISATNLFIRNNNIRLQDQEDYKKDLLSFLRDDRDCGTFSRYPSWSGSMYNTNLSALINFNHFVSSLES